jgi:hypothetical protein
LDLSVRLSLAGAKYRIENRSSQQKMIMIVIIIIIRPAAKGRIDGKALMILLSPIYRTHADYFYVGDLIYF